MAERQGALKLYLDDLRMPYSEEWTLVRTAEEACDLLATGTVEFACLDHDLGECDACDQSFPPRGYKVVANTCRHRMNGFALVEWMVKTGHWPKNKPTVHSANEVGAAKMRALIEESFQTSTP